MRKNITILAIIIAVVIFGKLIVDFSKYSPVLFQLLFDKTIELKKNDNRINILALGIGGGVHEGPNLTDTIIFISVDPATNRVTLVSIPRDLWIADLRTKINAAYAYGEEREAGGGLVLAKAVVSKVVGQRVDYGIRIDFDGFVKAVDLVGGLDIMVDKAFDDYEYPIEGKENDPCGHSEDEIDTFATSSSQLEAFPCRYKHIHFNKGLNHMDGKTALEFVRSRHAIGEEGSDFARSKRQEKVIEAFKNKVLSVDTFFNPGKVISLYGLLEKSIDTDIKQDEFDDFLKLAKQMRQAKIQSVFVDTGDFRKNREGLLTNPTDMADYDNQWVLIPKLGNGDFTQVQKVISCTLQNTCLSLTPTPIPGVRK